MMEALEGHLKQLGKEAVELRDQAQNGANESELPELYEMMTLWFDPREAKSLTKTIHVERVKLEMMLHEIPKNLI